MSITPLIREYHLMLGSYPSEEVAALRQEISVCALRNEVLKAFSQLDPAQKIEALEYLHAQDLPPHLGEVGRDPFVTMGRLSYQMPRGDQRHLKWLVLSRGRDSFFMGATKTWEGICVDIPEREAFDYKEILIPPAKAVILLRRYPTEVTFKLLGEKTLLYGLPSKVEGDFIRAEEEISLASPSFCAEGAVRQAEKLFTLLWKRSLK